MHFTANYWRFHEIDFIERSVHGAIPGTGFADWPITYAELEPYYTKVEWEIGVSGLAGANPFDPPRSQALPDAAAAGEVVGRAVRARRAQARPASVPAPMAINSQPYRGRPACVHCGFCHGFGCEVRRQVVDADDRDSRGRSHRPLRNAARQLRVPDRDRRATAAPPACTYFDAIGASDFKGAGRGGVCQRRRDAAAAADVGERRFPHGLANSSGMVGKYLMFNYSAGRTACSSINSTSTRACR